MPFPKNTPRQGGNVARLRAGEHYCMDCGLPTTGMRFINANGVLVCVDCAGSLADAFVDPPDELPPADED